MKGQMVRSQQSAEKALDEYLAASASIGDRRAMSLLAQRWHRKLLAHAWRLLGDPEAAKDAVQDGWSEIIRGLPRLADPGAFPAWTYRIVSRRCARLIDKARSERRLLEAIEQEPNVCSYQALGPALDAEKVRRAMTNLPAEQRAAIALFHLEEMSVAEVAVALDVPVGTIKTRLMNARRKLRAALEGDES
jgi:RNA polymerase sigma-70 factor (ECF subfamily)